MSTTGKLTAANTVAGGPPARFPPTASPEMVRLHLNEPAFGPSQKVVDAIAQHASAVGRYPDAQYSELRDKLASQLNVQAGQIICGNGSDELLALTGIAILQADSTMVLPTPSFPRYGMMAQLAGAKTIAVPVREDGACDPTAMLAACATPPTMMIVATPNNPTGQMLTESELADIAKNVPASTLLLIDEAYFEFAQHAGGCDALTVMRNARSSAPWLVMRTLSKAYALAGLRVGYAIASDNDVVEWVNRVRTPFHVNALAQIAALAALNDPAHMHTQVAACADERDRVAKKLTDDGLPCLPSVANFLAVDTGQPAGPVVEKLGANGLMIGAVGPAFPNHVRVSIGSPAENDRVIELLNALN